MVNMQLSKRINLNSQNRFQAIAYELPLII